jgi:hypothetical protein
MVSARKIQVPFAGDTLLVKSKKAVIRGAGLAEGEPDVTVTGSVVTLASTGVMRNGA